MAISWDEVAKYVVATPDSTKNAADVVNRFPDRFLFGTDAVAPPNQENYLKVYNQYEPFWKMLTPEASEDAPLGQLDYLIKGAMIGGFALIAAPADYRKTGVMTFMVSQDGVVYQKDLGPNTLEIAKKIDRFNPDKTWQPVLDDDQ